MSNTTVTRLKELGLYYGERKAQRNQLVDPLKKIEYLSIMVDELFELLVMQQEDISKLERKTGLGSSSLFVPTGMQVNGDVRKLG